MMQSEQINELAAALAKAQGAMSNAGKNRVNPHFKSQYADLAAVLDAIRGPLAANGLSYTQTMGFREGAFMLRTMLLHSSGQFIATEYPIPAVGNPQQMGAAQTYARRYSLAAIVGVAQDDDDGNSATANPPIEHKPAVISKRITAEELDDVRQKIDDTKTNVATMCRHFKIGSLMEITPEKLPDILAALKKKKEQQVLAEQQQDNEGKLDAAE